MNQNILKFIIIINLLLLAGQYFMTGKRATDGDTLSRLDGRLSVLRQQNSDLKNQILQLSSLSYLYTKVDQMQLMPVNVSFLIPLSVALANP